MKLTVDERWNLIDKIAKQTVRYGEYRHTLKDAIAEITVKPLTGIPIAIAVLYGFWSFFGAFAGFFTDGFLVKLFDNHWLPWLQEVFPGKGGWVYYILVGDPAADNCFEAFGMLTSGLFVAIGVVLPAIVAFYLFLIILEDSGYLPRLAVLIDTVLHKIGLHGFAVVPMILSLGCNVPAVAATRTLETRKQRFMMATLLAIFIPCGAQLGIMLEVIPGYVGFVMIYLLVGFFVFGFILNKLIPGKSPEILLDVPPYHMPTARNVGRKLWVRVRSFFTVAIPFVLLGVVIVNIMYLTGFLDWLANVLEPVLCGWFGVPKETVGPLIAAFLRKDLAVAQLSAIEMTTYQLVTSVVLVSLYFPCVATFAMLIKEGREGGWKGVAQYLFGSLAALIAVVFLWGGLVHLIWIILGVA
ncbi:MAG: ferrous iron transporter B [Thermoplasmata archaeon]|nr:ferrous iron transporter B [Thermoplasmata archaeon]